MAEMEPKQGYEYLQQAGRGEWIRSQTTSGIPYDRSEHTAFLLYLDQNPEKKVVVDGLEQSCAEIRKMLNGSPISRDFAAAVLGTSELKSHLEYWLNPPE